MQNHAVADPHVVADPNTGINPTIVADCCIRTDRGMGVSQSPGTDACTRSHDGERPDADALGDLGILSDHRGRVDFSIDPNRAVKQIRQNSQCNAGTVHSNNSIEPI